MISAIVEFPADVRPFRPDVRIFDELAGDAAQFPSLLDTTAKTFAVKEVVADSACASHANLQRVVDTEATPYIAFKESVSGATGDGFAKFYHNVQYNRDEFPTHDHKRTNIRIHGLDEQDQIPRPALIQTQATLNETLCKVQNSKSAV